MCMRDPNWIQKHIRRGVGPREGLSMVRLPENCMRTYLRVMIIVAHVDGWLYMWTLTTSIVRNQWLWGFEQLQVCRKFMVLINIYQLIKELWIANALANGYWTPLVLLKDYCSLLTIVIQNIMARWKLQLIDTHIPLNVKLWEGNTREKMIAMNISNMF